MTHDYAVVIGRMQLPHKGHFNLIHKALEVGDRVIICLGSSNLRQSLRNPFDVNQRIQMIVEGSNIVKDAVNSKRLYFIGIEDSCYSDQWWVEHVQRKITETIALRTPAFFQTSGKPNIALVGHKKDDTSYYLNMFPQWEYVGVDYNPVLSATECREFYYQFGPHDKSVQNRLYDYTTHGVINALKYIVPLQTYHDLKNRYTFVQEYKKQWGEGPFYTADAVVIKSGHLLLVTRGQEPDRGAWAFPGGFINKDEPSYRAATRECKEETGLDIFDSQVVANRTYDQDFRDDRGQIITDAFFYNLGFGELPEVKGGDDAAHAEWVPIADLRANNMAMDHYFIFRDLMRNV